MCGFNWLLGALVESLAFSEKGNGCSDNHDFHDVGKTRSATIKIRKSLT
jgi:hypothetical protein